MYPYKILRPVGALALALAIPFAAPLASQEREVVANEIAVSGSEASLRLEFADRGELSITFNDGVIAVDGEVLGSYERGDEVEVAWRSLLGQTLTLENGALVRALIAWSPPEGMTEGAGALAGQLDRALEAALTPQRAEVAEAEAEAPPAGGQTFDAGGTVSLDRLLGLVKSQDRLLLLVSALGDLEFDEVVFSLDDDLVIEADQVVRGSVLVVGGDLDLYGQVTGDIVVVDGAVHLFDGGIVEGDLRLADARLFRDGGTVEGRISDVDRDQAVSSWRDELRDELRQELQGSRAPRADRERSFFGSIGQGIGGVMGNLVSFAILLLIAGVVINFLPDRVDVVTDTLRQAPTRSMVVGASGVFLLLPVWILGMVILAVSIVGIPILIAWIPGLPLAAALAGGVGFLASARNVGEWISEKDIQGLDWVQKSQGFTTLIAGMGAFMAFFVAANLLHMAGGLLGVFEGLLTVVGTIAVIGAVLAGFGAVLLSRGGRRRVYADGVDFDFDIPTWTPRRPWRSAWEAAEETRRSGDDNGPADSPASDDAASEADPLAPESEPVRDPEDV